MEMRIFGRMRQLGILIAGASAVAFVTLLAVSLQIASAGHATCPGIETGCTILGHFPIESFIGLAALAALMFAGSWISIRSQKEFKTAIEVSSSLSKTAEQLTGDEKSLYAFVLQNEGTSFQNDIVKGLGYSKVKVSRILDRLEMKGLLERRRRGMANLIVLKK